MSGPDNIEAKVDFVTIYHMVIEGTSRSPASTSSPTIWRERPLPGFVDGFKKISRDEHRHVAYGTWFLKEKCGSDPAMAERMRACLNELLPIASGVLVPKGADPDDWTLLDYTSGRSTSSPSRPLPEG